MTSRSLEAVVAEFLRNVLASDALGVHDPLLPYGIEPTGHAWLHSRCWPAWYEGRKAHTVAILSAMGITPAGRPLGARRPDRRGAHCLPSGADVGQREPPSCR